MKRCKSYNIQIYVTGNINQIEAICSKFCYKKSHCVNLSSRRFIYNGGIEDGVCIEFINYAKYQDKGIGQQVVLATELAQKIVSECYQKSCSIVTPNNTYYFSIKED